MPRPLRPLVVLLLAAACSSSSPSAAPTPSATPTPSPTPTVSALPVVTNPPHHCGNAESGGSCLGALAPGRYASEGFGVPLTVTVPAGWSNEEDINGRYLLLPKGATRSGIDDDTSDYVRVFPSAVAEPEDCSEADRTADTKAADLASVLQKKAGVKATAPQPVTLGRLSGVVLDLRMAPRWKQTCPGAPYPVVPLFAGGLTPELVDYLLPARAVVRLYLLDSDLGVVGISVVDDSGGAHLAALDAVARSIVFS